MSRYDRYGRCLGCGWSYGHDASCPYGEFIHVRQPTTPGMHRAEVIAVFVIIVCFIIVAALGATA